MAYQPLPPVGQDDMAGSLPVVLASDQSSIPVTVSGVATAAKQDTGNTLLGTIDADTGGIATSTASIDTKTPALGQALAAASVPVVLTAAQLSTLTPQTNALTDTQLRATPVPVSGTVTAELSATDNAVLDDIAAKLGTIDTDTGNIATDSSAIKTAVQLLDDAVTTLGTDTYTEATSKGLTIGAVRRDADTTLVNTTNEFGPLQMNANGQLKVEAFSGEALPVTDNSTSLSVDWNGTQPVTGSGTATGALRVELPTNGTGVLATVSTVSALGTGTTGPQKAEDVASAGGDMGVAIMAARLDTPVANAAVSNDGDYTTPILDNYRKLWVTGTVPEDTAHVAGEAVTVMGARRIDTAATSAGSDADWGTVNQTAEGALWGALAPTTTSGCSIFRSLDIDETEEDVKTSAGNIYGYYFGNVATSVRYLKFYNATAANVTVGSTTPVLTLPLPASSSGHISFPYPIGFGTAISVACTTGVADADTGAPSANDVIINVFYK